MVICMTGCHILNIGGDVMPSKTFLNLPSEKQKMLIDASLKEFYRVPYTEASINQIILNAHISRGSFYTYFTDKNDLFGYLLELQKQRIFSLTKEVFISCNGDIRESFLKLYDIFTDEIKTNDMSLFLRNIFLYFNICKEKFTRPGHAFYLYVKSVIESSQLKDEDLEFVFHLFMHNLLIGITEAVKHQYDDFVRIQYRHKVDILCYGIYKEENKC